MAENTSESRPDLSSLRIADHKRPSRGRGKGFRVFAAALGAVVILTGLILAFRRGKPIVEVSAARPASDEKAATLLNASGYVTPRRRATVAAKITARVAKLYAEEGMRVTEGQVLAELDCSDWQVQLVSARADRDAAQSAIADLQVNLANANVELKRAQSLQATGIGTQQTLDAARTLVDSYSARILATREQVKAAEARVGVAQQNVNNCTVRSPFAGIVVSKDAQIGEMVSPISAGGGFTRTGIATVVDMNSIEIEVDVNEAYIARVLPGQRVTATLDAYPDWQIPCKVRTVIPTADRQKATVKVRISFDHLDPRILPDMGVKVAFLGDEPKQEKGEAKQLVKALVPSAAVREDAGKSFVFLVRDGRIERQAVSLGAARGDDVEILAGISQGDTVVVKGPEGMHEGQAVEIKR
ncbi:MAG: efflux RND transporter periplasmic adaptor subunit [Candidatus Acidiferrales bacterium]